MRASSLRGLCRAPQSPRFPQAASRWICALVLSVILAPGLLAQDAPRNRPDALVVGHWAQVKGELGDNGRFVAVELELGEPGDEESLLGLVTKTNPSRGRFEVLGQPVFISSRSEWNGLTFAELMGSRVKVSGHYRGPLKFSARSLRARSGTGRSRIEGRIDHITRRPGGLELRMLSFTVWLPDEAEVISEQPAGSWALAPARVTLPGDAQRDEEDDIPGAILLGHNLSLGIQLQLQQDDEEEFDLDDSKLGDKSQRGLSAKAELVWEPSNEAYALLRLRAERTSLRDANDPNRTEIDGNIAEAYGYWRDPFDAGFDLQLGRQDFDEPREWLYDQNLDGGRLIWHQPGWALELSATTTLTEGSREDRETDNFIAYLSNDDDKQHLAAYVIDRRGRGTTTTDKPLHVGFRALGEWLPDQKVWAEAALVRGYGNGVDFRGWAVDVGTTLDLEPFSLTLGAARGSGDNNPLDDVDHSFRQTGLHDNNGKFGGVTSFKTYGELVQPDLSNLDIFTAGLGIRLAKKTSLDLVVHKYRLVETWQLNPLLFPKQPPLFLSSLRMRPDGRHHDLGWGLDLILGVRETRAWDFEVVLGLFEPGAAFPGADRAWVTRAQVRHRF